MEVLHHRALLLLRRLGHRRGSRQLCTTNLVALPPNKSANGNSSGGVSLWMAVLLTGKGKGYPRVPYPIG
jgi:hypothetical protein